MTHPAGPNTFDGPEPYVAAPPAAPRSRRLLGAVAVVLAVGAGAFGVITLSAGDGSDDPGVAVEAMFDAIDHEDVIGVLEALAPNERKILRPAVEETRAQAERVKVASPDLDLRKVAGIDLEVKGLTYTTERLGDDVTAVDLTGGTISSATELDRLPLGSTVRRIVDRSQRRDGGADDDGRSEGRIELGGVRLVTTRSGGGWHVSALYSLAETIRLDQEEVGAVPDFGNGITTKGAADPEAAVREALAAAADLDVRRLIELTPAREAAVLHDYGALLVDAASEADESSGFQIQDLKLRTTDGPDGTKVVSPASYRATQTDGSFVTTYAYDGTCTTTTFDDPDHQDGPGDGSTGGPEVLKVCDDDANGRDTVLSPFAFFGLGGLGSQIKVVTEQHDGQWFISPTRSVIESTIGGLRDLSPEQVERTARTWFSDEYWLSQPDSFWEACGVTQPGLDTPFDDAENTYAKCIRDLPDDYQGTSGFPFTGFDPGGSSGALGYDPSGDPSFDPSASGPFPEESTPEDACYQNGSDAAIEACLRDLRAQGAIGPDALADFTCSSVYADLYGDEDGPDQLDEPDQAAIDAAEKAYQDCFDAAVAADTGPPVTTRSGSPGTEPTVLPPSATTIAPPDPGN